MAYDNDQDEFALPAGDQNNPRKSAELLPRYFRTQINKKFLASTLDQLLQPGVSEKVSGYLGRRDSAAYQLGDNYLGDVSKNRQDYQLEPSTVITDNLGNTTFYKDYNDYINQIAAFGGDISNQDRLNTQETYAWNPHIDWDKFVNFREYYWLPNGPQTVDVFGQTEEVESTIVVTAVDNLDNKGFVFSSEGATQNPTIELYRGQKYRFEIDTPSLPFSIKTRRTLDEAFFYNDGVSAQSIDDGVIEIEITDNTPEELYYVADNDINTGGQILVKDIVESSSINVEKEIINRKYYTTGGGWPLTNGMKIRFVGNVTPENYASGEYYVEGVGDRIKLIEEKLLEIPATYAEDKLLPFDTEGFDRVPFGNASSYAAEKDYIVINRASRDGNPWTRYNRWFHKDVIETSASLNNQPVTVDQNARARRPIIEFEAGLRLYKFGTQTKANVDLVDTFTKDVFSTVNGKPGYSVDNVPLTDGMRVLFAADTDILVKNKIYNVKFITHNNLKQIALIEADDAEPLNNETVLATKGDSYRGKMFYFDGDNWNLTQDKTQRNQQPLFDLYDTSGTSYSDETFYEATTFKGNKVFGYAIGTGTNDVELGFPLSYRGIENVGDILFNFDLLNQSFSYQILSDNIVVNSDVAYLKKYFDRETHEYVNSWTKAPQKSFQRVIRQYVIEQGSSVNNFAIDVYNDSGSLTDLNVKVFVNNSLNLEGQHYTIEVVNGVATVVFNNDLTEGDIVVLKTRSSATKVSSKGKYEFPHNLERNPQNDNIQAFTLGEVNDHVLSIVTEVDNFSGNYPGTSNLRDLGKVTHYGRKFVQHSGPINLPLYHITNKDDNIIKALRFSRKEYAKFKRKFLQTAYTLGYDGPVKQHVDEVLIEMNRDKANFMPFYFSDMLAYGATKNYNYTVVDSGNEFYALSAAFDLETLSSKSVNVYQNGIQLTYGKDYYFNVDGFCVITAEKAIGDEITIYEYESTDGSYIPPTPTKLGLYPKFIPAKYTDSTYVEPRTVIQGHDGSIVAAFNDYRDDLILELERRIYNNIKQSYDPSLLDIHEYIGGQHRDTRFERHTVNGPMTADFIEWIQRIGSPDYTLADFYDSTNPFTFNYKYMTDPRGNALPGFWRAVYKHAFDTDRPHTHPWEMLGYTVQPDWWEEVYGPAPYTKDNLILWTDLQEGNIRIPNTPLEVNKKYKRPGLLNHIPVDANGNLLSPLESNYAKGYVSAYTSSSYTFGDETPTETAWRKSSEYPFSLITSWLLNQPSKVLGVAFDISRMSRNPAGQLVYGNTSKVMHLKKLVFPNTSKETVRVLTSGLVNYVFNYLTSDVTISYDQYKENVTSLDNQLGAKIAGFTDKSKFKLILDSRTPLNQGNVFVPDENYKIMLNSSSPVEVLTYSGVIVEKQASGYIVRGYDFTNPTFTYYNAIPLETDTLINVGGITESFVEWTSGQRYTQGTNVEYNSQYYRCKEEHTASGNFEANKFAKLPKLPVVGGQDAFFRKQFEGNTVTIPYGHLFRTVQEVVDFLLGYGNYLESKGFVFDFYNVEIGTVENWKLSAKEFMFWTTQNWSAGALIALSPAASQLKYAKDYAVVDNIFDNFYNYTLLKADGQKLREEYAAIGRDNGNEFVIQPRNTADGIYHLKLPLVQKEHVVLIDNKTVFGDIIYDPEPGYRQERIKVQGYKSDNWYGGLNIPGFIYDDVRVTTWEQWKDYAIGSVVKYKEFYYVANNNAPGAEEFDSSDWTRLSERPESGLVTNFEYKVNQFADFYDLDSDNFDIEQQKLAQHLTGYQKRKYLENIINDDVSQFKFYQGFIADKGTRNAIDKLFDALGSANKDSVDFYEEWAIRKGQYGAVEGFDEVEFKLDESKFLLEPQPIDLVQTVPSDATDLIYRIRPFETYLKPSNYDHKPFPVEYTNNEFVKTTGYVAGEDVVRAVVTEDGILDLNINDINNGTYVWIAKDGQTWDVRKHVIEDFKIIAITKNGTAATFELDKSCTLTAGQIIGITDAGQTDGFYKVESVGPSSFTLQDTNTNFNEATDLQGIVTVFVSKRVSNLVEANISAQKYLDKDELVWVDDDDTGKWVVLKNAPVYTTQQIITNPENFKDKEGNVNPPTGFSNSIATNDENTTVVTGAPEIDKAYLYVRPADNTNLLYSTTLEPNSSVANNELPTRFGSSVAVSDDGEYIAVGAPFTSNVKTKYKGAYNEFSTYQKGDIVKYNENLYAAVKELLPATNNIEYTSFDAYAFYANETDSTEINLLQLGSYRLPESTVDHILVKAPLDMWRGTAVGDVINLAWNSVSVANLTDTAVEPFPNNNTITSSVIIGDHEIVEKVDHVFFIQQYLYLPLVGDTISTGDASGTVVYVDSRAGSATVYVNNVKGEFTQTGHLYINEINLVGQYEEDFYQASPYFGGYWLINTPQYNNTNNVFTDPGQGLVYKNVRGIDDDDTSYYRNVRDLITVNPTSLNQQASFITQLTYEGAPGPGEIADTFNSSKWVVRMPAEATPQITVGLEFNIWLDNILFDVADYNLPYSIINRKQTVTDIWDGYIDFTFKNFDNFGLPYEPAVGDTIRDMTTDATAEVVFYQRNFNTVRVYVNNVQGTWSNGTLWGERSNIQRDAPPGADPTTTPDREMGEIEAVSLGSSLVGKLVVLDEGTDFILPGVDITDQEYWIYTEREGIAGIPRLPSYPSSANLDWNEVFNITANSSGTASPLLEEGLVYLYKRLTGTDYILDKMIIAPERIAEGHFGKDVKIAKQNDLYTLFISADSANTGASLQDNSPGNVFIFKNGSDSAGTYEWELARDRSYRGAWSSTVTYREGEIVEYNSVLYTAITNIANSAIPGVDFGWEETTESVSHVGFVPTNNQLANEDAADTSKLIKFATEFDINSKGNVLVVATEAFATDALISVRGLNTRIKLVNQSNTDLGYEPVLKDGETTTIEINFQDSSSVSYEVVEINGSVVRVKDYNDELAFADLTGPKEIVFTRSGVTGTVATATEIKNISYFSNSPVFVYRSINGHFHLDQRIYAPSVSAGFGTSIAISEDGKLLAISEPYSNEIATEQGKVYVYSLVNGQFELSQTLHSPNNEKGEEFGFRLDFDGNQLVVTSLDGDISVPTTIDGGNTIFDNNFTGFKRVDLNSGVVYVYQRINDTLVYAQQLDFQEIRDDNTFLDTTQFGKNIKLSNNHIYIGLPRLTDSITDDAETITGSYTGALVDYRKPIGSVNWTRHRTPIDQVNVKKFRGAFLYNTSNNTLVSNIDIIDPIQGKIAGPAEQEITFKTVYDPAVYSTATTGSVIVDSTNSWTTAQVGKVWWDLSTARFYNPYQGDIVYQTNYWNKLFPTTSIDVYEWVESTLTPEDWDKFADTETGLQKGISGKTKYGNAAYVEKRKYNKSSGTFSSVYYYWVKNKTTVPQKEFRSESVAAVAQLIANPAAQGYKFAALLGDNKFVIYNCANLLKDNDIAVNFSYWTIDEKEQNIHNEYQIITLDDSTSLPKRDIELKWFDSLIGYDAQSRPVPDPNLGAKQKYGTLFKPRQSWFVNRIEALKQVVDRTNAVLQQNIIVGEYNLSRLFESDPKPTLVSRHFDTIVDTESELQFVGTAKVSQAKLEPLIENGKIVRVNIIESGRGYRVEPTYEIIGTGTGAKLEFVLDLQGKITEVNVLEGGKNYTADTSIVVRKFSVLVDSDTNVSGKWAIYERDNGEWNRILTQDFDVTLYWEYADWYADGYNEFSPITYYVNESYELTSTPARVGDTVKISNVGTGGWLLLERIALTNSEDYTIDYKTIGRENGTIQFKDSLYNVAKSLVGYDGASYDTQFFDSLPVKELRILLETLRDDLLVDELAVEYNKLFFASLRYVFTEQSFVDWAFKTSFIKARHNVGDLEQSITFKNDNLASYEDYIQEVKPYKTKIREYVSSYEGIDNSNTVTTDFDLPPKYNQNRQTILPQSIQVIDNTLVNVTTDVSDEYPRKHWYDNAGYKVTEIVLSDQGSGYLGVPQIKINDGGGTGATAKAYYSAGKITKVEVLTPGSGYLSAPIIEFDGALSDTGTPAKATAILSDNVVRSTNIKFKFDRVSGNFYITDLAETETFQGSGNITKFDLKWPLDIATDRINIFVNGIEALSQEYTVTNISDFDKGYTRQKGRIEFIDPPAFGAEIKIHYFRNIEQLTAQDRINYFYNPTSGQIGKDVSQLMDGIDYGGVEVRSFDFGAGTGWDSDEWYTTTWDTYDTTFEDEIIQLDGSTEVIELSKPLETGVAYNIYRKNEGELNAVRLDDPNFGTAQQTNPNAVCQTITGAGQTLINIGDLGIVGNQNNDVIIVRKTTSDGSFLPDPITYDTQLSGGDLNYQTAQGINAEDIIIDGDGFVTPTTSKGPEELVPGQILDTLDIKVFDRAADGAGVMHSQMHITNGVDTRYVLGVVPGTNNGVFVKLDGVIVDQSAYTIETLTHELVFNTAPAANKSLSIITTTLGAQNILDIDRFIADGSTQDFVTRVKYQEGMSFYLTVDGEVGDAQLLEADDTFGNDEGYAYFKLATAPAANSVIGFGLFSTDNLVNFSQVSNQQFIGDGSTSAFELETTPFYNLPEAPNVIVKLNDRILNPGYQEAFTVSAQREYQLRSWQQPGITLTAPDIKVYLNNVELALTVDWRWDVYNSAVILFNGVGVNGDKLDVYVINDGDFVLSDGVLELNSTPVNGDIIEVTQFSNHDILGIDRKQLDVVTRSSVTFGTNSYTEYHNLTTGLIKLSKPAFESRYVWVILNGNQLVPDVDYYVTDNRQYVKIATPLVQNDEVQIIHFTESLTTEKFGYRQFKDMLNRVHFKRMYTNSKYVLAQDLNYYDLRIEVEDASDLPEPNKTLNIPGVIFIEGERIEYMNKDGNSLRQLRRGTLGTGVKAFYAQGTEFMDQSQAENVPYRDETISTVFEADGTQTQFTLDFDATDLVDKYRESTGVTLDEAMFFEVFVAGRRLRKSELAIFDLTLDQDSPEADVTHPAEFSATGTTLTLAEAPLEGQKVIVIRKVGKAWTEQGTQLRYAENDISKFLRAKTVSLPK
jgi:hypothetical protein